MSDNGISLALFEVEVATEVEICLTGCATEGLETMPANSGPTKSVKWLKSSMDSSVANGSGSCNVRKV